VRAADYMGINGVFSLPMEATFELQFHTMQSLDTKMQRCHQSYSKFREERSMVKAQVRAPIKLTTRPSSDKTIISACVRSTGRRWCGCGRSYLRHRASARSASSLRTVRGEKTTPFKACCEVFLASTLTYVCPEPVLAKHHDASVFVRMKVQLQTE